MPYPWSLSTVVRGLPVQLSAYSMDMALVHGSLIQSGEREVIITVAPEDVVNLRQRRLWSVCFEGTDRDTPVVVQLSEMKCRGGRFEVYFMIRHDLCCRAHRVQSLPPIRLAV